MSNKKNLILIFSVLTLIILFVVFYFFLRDTNKRPISVEDQRELVREELEKYNSREYSAEEIAGIKEEIENYQPLEANRPTREDIKKELENFKY